MKTLLMNRLAFVQLSGNLPDASLASSLRTTRGLKPCLVCATVRLARVAASAACALSHPSPLP